MIELSQIAIAFSLTMFAGLATGVGSALAFFTKRTNKTFLAISLGFSAGVMLYVSFVEIFRKGVNGLLANFSVLEANTFTVASFFGGILFIAIIDKFIPTLENPHEPKDVEMLHEDDIEKISEDYMSKSLLRMGIFTALAIAIHNFPEGLVTFLTAIDDPGIGLAIAFAIAIHNIPEGIAVSVPIFYATGDRKKAFIYSFLSGLAEPIGALIGYTLFIQFISDSLFGILFGFVAGIMVFISLDELLPSAEKYGEHHLTIYGLITGMFIMAISLLLFL